jgi:hypothetical protein
MNIIEMGIQAGLCDEEGRDDNSIIIEDHLERFAKLVAAHEREECAKMCEEQYEYYGHDHIFAKAIRARSNT